MDSFKGIIDAFGGVVPFRHAMGLKDLNARQMHLRNSIPPGYWPRVVDEAKLRNIEGVTLEALAGIAKAKLEESLRAKNPEVAA